MSDHALPMVRPAASPIERANATFLSALFFILCGYAIGGRGFAYIGIAPLYIGEFVMVVGILTCLRTGLVGALLKDQAPAPVALFMGWGLFRTLPYISQYGPLAIRDAMIWGYGTFAFLVASSLMASMDNPSRLRRFLQFFSSLFIVCLPPVFVINEIFGSSVPMWPGTTVPIILLKAGDAMVHMGGIAVLLLAGLIELSGPAKFTMTALSLVLAARARSGMAGFIAALGFPVMLAPVRRYVFAGCAVLALLFGLAWATDFKVRLTDNREFSAQTLTQTFTAAGGMFGNSSMMTLAKNYTAASRLNATIIWRVIWWYFLYNDVRDRAPATGLGFGMSLALPGIPVAIAEDVRSPHNCNMTVLGRMGFIGLGLWLLMLFNWFRLMIGCHFRALRTKRYVWASFFMVLPAWLLAAWVNGSFDIYLEGPMGGIWFWTLIGAGAAMRRWFRVAPGYWDAGNSAISQTQ